MDEKSIETLRYPSYTKYKQLMQESMLMLENSIPKINPSD
jgi:hypothetical protein